MTLKIIEPIMVSDANITASNVALETAWTAGTYSLGDVRRVGERLWEVSAATTTQEPGDDATEWFDAGPANRYAAFDLQFGADKFRVVETKTTNADEITFTLESMTRISAIAMFGLVASRIQIVATVDATGDAADIDYTLADSTQFRGSFWRWCFVPQSIETQYVEFGLNIPRGASVDITITNTGGTAEVGTIALGIAELFGTVEIGASRNLRSRSVKRTDGPLTSLLRRAPSARVGYPVFLDDYAADSFWRAVDRLDGVAAVFSGPDINPEFTIYGFVTSCQSVSHAHGKTKVQIEVEAL